MSNQTIDNATVKLTTNESAPSPLPVEQKPVDFGKGRYSPEMERIYGELQKLLRIEPKKAEKLARQAASDFGEMIRNQTAKMKVGKANSDGCGTIGETVAALKGVKLTYPLSFVHTLQWMGEAGKHGIKWSITLWELDDNLAKYVAEMEVK